MTRLIDSRGAARPGCQRDRARVHGAFLLRRIADPLRLSNGPNKQTFLHMRNPRDGFAIAPAPRLTDGLGWIWHSFRQHTRHFFRTTRAAVIANRAVSKMRAVTARARPRAPAVGSSTRNHGAPGQQAARARRTGEWTGPGRCSGRFPRFLSGTRGPAASLARRPPGWVDGVNYEVAKLSPRFPPRSARRGGQRRRRYLLRPRRALRGHGDRLA